MRTMQGAAAIAAAMLLGAAPLAQAASDGNYKPERQHCSGGANESANPDYEEHGCHNWTLTVSDYGGHEYFGWGLQQTKVGEVGLVPDALPFGTFSSTHEVAYWYDPGPDQGGCVYNQVDLATGASTEEPCPWFDPTAPNYYGPNIPPDPSTGLRVYFGADDNLAGGEHDGSSTVDNGPSDGGAVELNLNPANVMRWIANLQAAQNDGLGKLLVHPLPLIDGGIGACADGVCISAQTTRRSQAYPDGTPNYQPVADYSGHEWDPEECSGANGGVAEEIEECGGKTIAQWNEENGDPAIEPGVQIYEDPDAQGSPLGGSYPIPAIYVGTCGVIIGGGELAQEPMPPSQPGAPYINSAGQLVIPTGCDQTADDYDDPGSVM